MRAAVSGLLIIIMIFTVILPMTVAAESENLVSGLTYTVKTGEPISESYANYIENGIVFDTDSGQLTDSVTALTSESSAGWYRAYRGGSRIVEFDLGAECSVREIRAGFLHIKASGIYAPSYVTVSLATEPGSFGTALRKEVDFDFTNDTAVRCDVTATPDSSFRARYVRVEFECAVFCYCDEISVYGSRTVSNSDKSITPDTPAKTPGYCTDIGGAKDIIKLYNGYYAPEPEKAVLTEEKLLPYIAYLDTFGNISDTLFDSAALVPCHGDYPSGGRLVYTNGKPGAVMSDWELYFESNFFENGDLDTLEATVEKVYTALGKSEKFGVFLTLPYPTPLGNTPFGDINGDGREEYCESLGERVDIIEWYALKCISAFRGKGYKHIYLAGFYWYKESVDRTISAHEEELIKAANSYAERRGLKTLFDAYYLASGIEKWESLGFSAAVMQPNVAFTESYPYFKLPMLDEFSETAAKYRLGVEMETNEPSFFMGNDYLTAGRNYESYLYYGVKNGYADAVKTYYQGAGPGSIYDFCHADVSSARGKYLRRLYDITYSFIKGNYKNEPPVVSADDIELYEGDSKILTDITVTDTDSFAGDITVSIVEAPKNGDAAVVSGNKRLVYSPRDGFTGEDSFTVIASDGFNSSEPITVHVKVHPKSDIISSSENSGGSSEPSENARRFPTWLLAVLILLGVGIVASVASVAVRAARRGKAG